MTEQVQQPTPTPSNFPHRRLSLALLRGVGTYHTQCTDTTSPGWALTGMWDAIAGKVDIGESQAPRSPIPAVDAKPTNEAGPGATRCHWAFHLGFIYIIFLRAIICRVTNQNMMFPDYDLVARPKHALNSDRRRCRAPPDLLSCSERSGQSATEPMTAVRLA
ncbi:hypothetical protein BP6252_06618 [Coleophoma cylindrospora]|uniref:Uncharacterized protein n=1 Tax=Coleophoma cylindrospora TaxID=1849047 RepID=A0A3D8RNE7_9HELO|nr:hypothetical protein BP6252_06618 [Coleophoma cylindrospora]